MSGQRGLGEDEPPRAGSGALLRYNSPLSAERARLLVEVIGERPVDDVLDVGCGWGTLLLDVLEDQPAARGTGIDLHEPDIQRARREADERGLGDRATFLARDAADETTDAGLVLNIGAFHVFGTIPEAFSRLHMLTRPGGRLLFGAEYARHVPTDDELARVWEGTRSDDFHLLSDLLDRAIDAGFRPLAMSSVTDQEWEEYESGHMREREQWLADHPAHPAADAIRRELDAQRSIWLRGHRSFLGFAYVVLARSR
jgi:cyclopropane fatty-acyl-phospholipid synthase-like methyltransferase